VGDLLTFAPRLVPGPRELLPGVGKGDLSQHLGRHLGLRRGTSATHWYDAGCRLEAGDPQGAIAAYERALAGCPGLADAHNNLGRLLHDAGSLAAAETSYRLAICAEGGVALYWFNLGVVVEDQGRRAEAIAAYQRAIELDDQVADAHYNLARLLELTARRLGDNDLLQRAVRHLLRYRALTRRTAGAR
jgi:tetratricopeptide (TPR) repeat protein